MLHDRQTMTRPIRIRARVGGRLVGEVHAPAPAAGRWAG
jgi:hypothetical protein